MVFLVCSPLLAEDGPVGVVGGIGIHLVSKVGVWVGEYRGGGYYVLEGLECRFFFGHPHPWAVILCEVVEGSGDVCESFDKAPVEVAEPNEFSHTPDLGGGFPFADRTAFVFIHVEPVTR